MQSITVNQTWDAVLLWNAASLFLAKIDFSLLLSLRSFLWFPTSTHLLILMMLSFYTFRILAAFCKHIFTWMFLCGWFMFLSLFDCKCHKGEKKNPKMNDLMSEERKRTPDTLKISFFSLSCQYIRGHLEASDRINSKVVTANIGILKVCGFVA